MTTDKTQLKAGTRSSRRARVQTRDALDRLEACFPTCIFEDMPISSPGDRDLTTDLRQSPPDFFTQDLIGRCWAANWTAPFIAPKIFPILLRRDWIGSGCRGARIRAMC